MFKDWRFYVLSGLAGLVTVTILGGTAAGIYMAVKGKVLPGGGSGT